MQYGVRCTSETLPPLPDRVRRGASITERNPGVLNFRPVSASLPIRLRGHTLPKIDPCHPQTVALGFKKRVVNPLTEDYDLSFIEEFGRFVDGWLIRNLVPLDPESDVSVDHWLETANYPAWRKDELRSLDFDEVANWRAHGFCKSFIKDEFYAELKHARTINPRDDYFKVFSGPIFHLIEKAVFQLPCFIKKVPIKDRAEYIKEHVFSHGARYVCTDYTSFESSFTAPLMHACEMKLYRYMTQALPDGDVWFEGVRDTLTGVQHLKHRYVTVKTPAGRCSGDMCTSLGNGFTNLLLMEFAAHKLNLGTLHGVFEGDDGLCRFSSGEVPFGAFFSRLGFVVKMEVVDDISRASFCGMLFDPDSCQQIGDPRAFLATFGWTSAKYCGVSKRKALGLCRSKALSAAHQWVGCPVISAFAHRVIELTEGVDVDWIIESRNTSWWDRQRLLQCRNPVPKATPTWQTRLLFADIYDISPDEQIRLESQLSSLDVGEFELDVPCMPALWEIIERDYVLDKPADVKQPFHGARIRC